MACVGGAKSVYKNIKTSRSDVFWPETGGTSVEIVFIDANHDVRRTNEPTSTKASGQLKTGARARRVSSKMN